MARGVAQSCAPQGRRWLEAKGWQWLDRAGGRQPPTVVAALARCRRRPRDRASRSTAACPCPGERQAGVDGVAITHARDGQGKALGGESPSAPRALALRLGRCFHVCWRARKLAGELAEGRTGGVFLAQALQRHGKLQEALGRLGALAVGLIALEESARSGAVLAAYIK